MNVTAELTLHVTETDCGDIQVVNMRSDNADVVAVLENTGDEMWMAWNVRPVAYLFAAAPDLLTASLAVLALVESEGRDTGEGGPFSDLRDAIARVNA